jgi:hypothetical protein
MKYDEIVAKAREIVSRHPLPDFVTRFEVRLGEFDGDPAMWIVYKTLPEPPGWNPEVERRVPLIGALMEAVQPDLLNAFEDRFPYFRFETDHELNPVAE